ncbi:MAG TPA: hypothetical protein VJ808_11920, partial [Gemmatimonadales bacterium]|nr:hypothetical protein [Gemmatimonadales bacterium]
MPLTGRPLSVVVVLAGLMACAGARPGSPSPSSPSSPSAPSFHQIVSPFPVFDSAGKPLDLAFLGGFNAPRPQLVDVDADDDLDLLIQEVTGKVALFERVGVHGAGRTGQSESGTTRNGRGLPEFRFSTSRYAGLDVGEWYRFADVDQDGDLDLLAEQPYSYIKY